MKHSKENGITLTAVAAQIQCRKESLWRASVWPGAVFALLWSALLLLPGQSGWVWLSLPVGLAAVVLLETVRLEIGPKAGKHWPAAAAVAAVAAAVCPGVTGALCNRALTLWQRLVPQIYPQFRQGGAAALPVGVCALAVLCALGLCRVLESRRTWPLWLLAAFLGGVTLPVGALNSTAGALLWLAGVLLLVYRGALARGALAAEHVFSCGPVQVLCAALSIAVATGVVLATGLAARQEPTAAGLHENISRTVSRLRYGEGSGLPEGDLTRWTALRLSDEPALKVTMEYPQAYYLRGYVGDSYQDGKWQSVAAEELCKEDDLFYWLHQENFYGQTQLARAALETDPSAQTQRMEVQVLQASRKYLYFPYELNDRGLLPARQIGDGSVRAGGLRGETEYGFEVLAPQVTNADAIAGTLLQESAYLQLEGYYNQSVYTTELDIPDLLRQTMEEIFGQVEIPQGQRHAEYAQAQQKILTFLTGSCTYSEEAQIPEGDPLVWFLKTGRTGYSVQMASAAAMAFRYFGIPARYVEGYLLTPEDAASATAGGSVTLDGTHAHAWVEYYRDGVGWIPFEVTQPYLTVMPAAQPYQQSGSPSETDLLENQDTDETGTEEDPQQSSTDPLVKVLTAILCGLLALLALFGLWVLLGRMRARRRLAGVATKEPAEAIDAVFRHMMRALFLLGLSRENCPVEQYRVQLEQLLGKDLTDRFYQAAQVRREALFSGCPATEAQRREVLSIWNAIFEYLMKNSTGRDRFTYKYLYFM